MTEIRDGTVADNAPADPIKETCFVRLDEHADEIKAPGSAEFTVSPDRGNLHCVTFHDVSYEVPQRKRCIRQPNKIILNSVRLVRRRSYSIFIVVTAVAHFAYSRFAYYLYAYFFNVWCRFAYKTLIAIMTKYN